MCPRPCSKRQEDTWVEAPASSVVRNLQLRQIRQTMRPLDSDQMQQTRRCWKCWRRVKKTGFGGGRASSKKCQGRRASATELPCCKGRKEGNKESPLEQCSSRRQDPLVNVKIKGKTLEKQNIRIASRCLQNTVAALMNVHKFSLLTFND